MNWRDYIEHHPDVLAGKPVFKGTRLSVALILQRLGDGVTEADLFGAHPRLRPEHIRAAQAYAAAMLALVGLNVDAESQARIDRLARKCNEGELTAAERAEYAAYVEVIDLVAILQAKARALLAAPPDPNEARPP